LLFLELSGVPKKASNLAFLPIAPTFVFLPRSSVSVPGEVVARKKRNLSQKKGAGFQRRRKGKKERKTSLKSV
jgi:hypothetical protein